MKKFLLFTILFLAQFSFAYCLDWKNLHEEADRISGSKLEKVADKNNTAIEELYILGLVYLNLREEKNSLSAFENILKNSPGLREAEWGRAECLRRQRNTQESKSILNKIIKASPDFSPAYISLAYIKYLEFDFQGTVRLALKVIRQGHDKVDLSNYTRAHLLLAGARGMLAQEGGFVAKLLNGTTVFLALKKAERLQPDSPAVLFGVGSFYFLAPAFTGGNKDKALDYLGRAIKADPFFADAYVRLSQVYAARGDEKKAKEYLECALKIDPANELALDAISGKCRFICVSLKE